MFLKWALRSRGRVSALGGHGMRTVSPLCARRPAQKACSQQRLTPAPLEWLQCSGGLDMFSGVLAAEGLEPSVCMSSRERLSFLFGWAGLVYWPTQGRGGRKG